MESQLPPESGVVGMADQAESEPKAAPSAGSETPDEAPLRLLGPIGDDELARAFDVAHCGVLDFEPPPTNERLREPATAPPPLPGKRPPSEARWHVALEGQRLGPLTSPRILDLWATGELSPATPVWRPGMTDWCALREVEELSRAMPLELLEPTLVEPAPVTPPRPTRRETPPLLELASGEMRALTVPAPRRKRDWLDELAPLAAHTPSLLDPPALPRVEPEARLPSWMHWLLASGVIVVAALVASVSLLLSRLDTLERPVAPGSPAMPPAAESLRAEVVELSPLTTANSSDSERAHPPPKSAPVRSNVRAEELRQALAAVARPAQVEPVEAVAAEAGASSSTDAPTGATAPAPPSATAGSEASDEPAASNSALVPLTTGGAPVTPASETTEPSAAATTGPDAPGNDAVAESLAAFKPRLAQCADEQRAFDSSRHGTLVLRWKVDALGRAADIAVEPAALAGTPVATCSVRELSSWEFPRHPGPNTDEARLSYDF